MAISRGIFRGGQDHQDGLQFIIGLHFSGDLLAPFARKVQVENDEVGAWGAFAGRLPVEKPHGLDAFPGHVEVAGDPGLEESLAV